MKPVVLTFLVCSFCFFVLGCQRGSGNAEYRQVSANFKSAGRGEACKLLSDYVNRIELIYRQNEWIEIRGKLSEAEANYRSQMSKLAEAGKWTPRQDFRKSLELPFLLGRFHGALQSCKIDRERNDKALVACDQVRDLKDEICELCSK